LFAYALSPGLLGGFFRIIDETFVLHILLLMYAIYLTFAGIAARFGEDGITFPFLFLILIGVLCSMVTFAVATAAFGIPPGYY